MLKKIETCWVINAATIALVLSVCGLSIDAGWFAYNEYRAATQLVSATRLADQIIDAQTDHATERGMISAALGSGGLVDPVILQRVHMLRARTEEDWHDILASAHQLSNDNRFAQAIDRAVRTHALLQQARANVDLALVHGARGIDVNVWIRVVTTFITDLEQLRRTAFLSDIPLNEVVTLNLLVRSRVWQAGEYAGLERGILAYYISARRAIPLPVLQDLWAYRGTLENNVEELESQSRLSGADERMQGAVGAMALALRRFDAQRAIAYAAAASGNYPLTGEQWFTQASSAIDSILAVGLAVSGIIDSKAHDIGRGSKRHIALHISLLIIGLCLAAISLAKVRQTTRALSREKELAEVTLHSIGDAVITTDAQSRVEYMNPVAEELTGWHNPEAAGRALSEVFNIVNRFTRQREPNPVEECLRKGHVVGLGNNTVLQRRDGTEVTVEDSAAPIHDHEGRVVGAVMVFYDVSMQRHAPHLLSYNATHDALTGLANRREFERLLSERLDDARRSGGFHSLCYIDIDQFKVVNDTCGHVAGDKLLRQLTHLLQGRLRDADILARLGGDEFGVLLEHCPLDKATFIANELCQVMKNFHFVWQDMTFELGGSIGLVPITPDSISPAEILSEADAACYAAKEKGRNRVQVYQPGDLDLVRRHGEMQWVSRIGQALKENRFELHCQLIVPLGSGDVHHEVLLRLRGENDQLVPPMDFIPAAECCFAANRDPGFALKFDPSM